MWYEIKSTRLNSVTLSVDSSAHLASAKNNSNYIFTQSEWAQTAAGTLQSTNFNVQGGYFLVVLFSSVIYSSTDRFWVEMTHKSACLTSFLFFLQ